MCVHFDVDYGVFHLSKSLILSLSVAVAELELNEQIEFNNPSWMKFKTVTRLRLFYVAFSVCVRTKTACVSRCLSCRNTESNGRYTFNSRFVCVFVHDTSTYQSQSSCPHTKSKPKANAILSRNLSPFFRLRISKFDILSVELELMIQNQTETDGCWSYEALLNSEELPNPVNEPCAERRAKWFVHQQFATSFQFESTTLDQFAACELERDCLTFRFLNSVCVNKLIELTFHHFYIASNLCRDTLFSRRIMKIKVVSWGGWERIFFYRKVIMEMIAGDFDWISTLRG